ECPRPRQVRPDIPPALEAICLKAMSPRPQDRYATPQELAADIEHFLADQPVSAYREPWYVGLLSWAGRHLTLLAGDASALAVACVRRRWRRRRAGRLDGAAVRGQPPRRRRPRVGRIERNGGGGGARPGGEKRAGGRGGTQSGRAGTRRGPAHAGVVSEGDQ